MKFAEFVGNIFVPEYVSTREPAGREHFRSMLKHAISPEAVDLMFRKAGEHPRSKLSKVDGWPYLDAIVLQHATPHHIQKVVTACLHRGYSAQTAAHVRNVVRSVFSYARVHSHYHGENPADEVTVPDISPRSAAPLTFPQLRQVVGHMRYPEKEISLMAVVTGMNIAEICGLRWKDVNASQVRHFLENEWVPPQAIRVRNRLHRGVYLPVIGRRNRIIVLPEAYSSHLSLLKDRHPFPNPDDFVISTRLGTPFSAHNIAARRLKAIGKALGHQRLSWQSFLRTHPAMMNDDRASIDAKLKEILQVETIINRRSQHALRSRPPRKQNLG